MNRESPLTSSKVFFPNLDGLRTIAFLFVYLQHGFWKSFEFLNIPDGSFFDRLVYGVGNGGTGVSIFFVLSGFLITYLLITERIVKGKIHIWYFYVRRILRIWPLYFVVIFFALALYPFLKSLIGIDSHLASRPLYYITFLSNFDVINIQKYHEGASALMGDITWSVAIEEQFYLLWPLLFLLVPKRSYVWIFATVILTCLIFRYFHRNDQIVKYYHSLSVCADLAIGGICAYFSIAYTKFIAFFEKLSKKSILAFYLLGFAWMLYSNYLMNSFTEPIMTRLINTCFFAFIILEQNFSQHSFYKFSRFKTLTFWGKYTYGLYLLHPIALLLLDVGLRTFNTQYENSFWTLFSVGLAGLALSLLLSYLSYENFEKRFLRLKEQFSFVRKQVKVLEHTETQLQNEKSVQEGQVA